MPKTRRKCLRSLMQNAEQIMRHSRRVAQKYYNVANLTSHQEFMADIERHAVQLQDKYNSGKINDFLTTKPILPTVLEHSLCDLLRSNFLYGTKQKKKNTNGKSSEEENDIEEKVDEYIPNILNGTCYQKAGYPIQ